MPAGERTASTPEPTPLFGTNNAASGVTLTGPNIAGAAAVVDLQMTGTLTAAASAQLPTVAALLAALKTDAIGTGISYRLRIANVGGGAFAWTVTTNTGWTLNGTMSIPQNTWREFIVTLTSLTTATLQSVVTGTWS
jgi:hypothetical protein